MTIHVYHPYRQPDGENFCQAVNGHCSHLCLPAPKITERSPRISCACPTGLKLMDDGLMCVEDGKSIVVAFLLPFPTLHLAFIFAMMKSGEMLCPSRLLAAWIDCKFNSWNAIQATSVTKPHTDERPIHSRYFIDPRLSDFSIKLFIAEHTQKFFN